MLFDTPWHFRVTGERVFPSGEIVPSGDIVNSLGTNVVTGISIRPNYMAHILRAVNAHDAFVETVKAAVDGEDDECRFDHHGYCQTHRLQERGKCYVALGKAALALAEGK